MEMTTNKTKTAEVSKYSDGFLQRVNKPDASQEDVARLKKMLVEMPMMASLAGNLADRTQRKMIDDLSSVPLIKESTKVYIEQMKEELGWQDSPMLERLLIETIVSCWLQYHNAAIQFSFATSRSHSIKEGEYLDERVSLAHKRFLKSIESLAKVRKLTKSTPITIPIYDPVAYGNPRNTVME